VVTVFDLESSRSYAYDRRLNGDLLTFRKVGDDHIADVETGSKWQIENGGGISGTYKGKVLSPSGITSDQLFPYHGVAAHPIPLISIWQRFDANWYLLIAQRGYGFVIGDVHFPPLYPVLIKFLSLVLGDEFLSALIVSQAALYIAVKLLYDLFVEWGGDDEAVRRSLFLLLIFPASFFLFSAYTEAIFVIFAVLCLMAARNDKWHWAGFWIFCAILVRLQGVALLFPIAWIILSTRPLNMKFAGLFLVAAGSAVAMGVYLLIRAKGGDPSIIPFVESNLHARIVPPWENLVYSIRYIVDGQAGFIDIINLAAFILFSVLLAVNWRRFPVEFSLYSAASIVLLSMRLVDTQPLNSMIRYLITIFPVFYLFSGYAGSKWLSRLSFICFLSLNLFLSAQFFLWGWVA
jgi:hypothetical protein